VQSREVVLEVSAARAWRPAGRQPCSHRQVITHHALRIVPSHSESISLSRCIMVPEEAFERAREAVSNLVDQIEQERSVQRDREADLTCRGC
jgi:hypothetical protein